MSVSHRYLTLHLASAVILPASREGRPAWVAGGLHRSVLSLQI